MSEMGKVEQSIIDQALRSKSPIPDKILNAPILREDLTFYLQAYLELETERPVGFGLYRIPWHSIMQYGEYYQLTEDEADRLLFFIRQIDNAIINKYQAEHPRK